MGIIKKQYYDIAQKTEDDHKHKMLVSFVLDFLKTEPESTRNTKKVQADKFVERLEFQSKKHDLILNKYGEYQEQGKSLYDFMVRFEQQYSMFGEQ